MYQNFVKVILLVLCIVLVLLIVYSKNYEKFNSFPTHYPIPFHHNMNPSYPPSSYPLSYPSYPSSYPPSSYSPHNNNNGISNNNNAPLTYPIQLYPRIPWYPKSGLSCNSIQECGATSSCVNGTCIPNWMTKKTGNNTVFETPVR